MDQLGKSSDELFGKHLATDKETANEPGLRATATVVDGGNRIRSRELDYRIGRDLQGSEPGCTREYVYIPMREHDDMASSELNWLLPLQLYVARALHH